MEPMADRINLKFKISNLKLVRVWLMMASRGAQSQLLTRIAGVLFLCGKIIRFLIFFVFLFAVLDSAKTLAGYSKDQVILFFLVFNIIDIASQFLFRGVYNFRFLVLSGDYDLDLLKPLPAYFRPIFGIADILDFLTLIPLLGYFLWFGFNKHFFLNPALLILFFLLIGNSLVLSFALHLVMAAVCLLTNQIDPLVWIYRDLNNMARFPTEIYSKGIQAILSFTIPVIILITVPAKALLGLLSWQWVMGAFLITGLFLFGSLKFWRYALSRYSSASS